MYLCLRTAHRLVIKPCFPPRDRANRASQASRQAALTRRVVVSASFPRKKRNERDRKEMRHGFRYRPKHEEPSIARAYPTRAICSEENITAVTPDP